MTEDKKIKVLLIDDEEDLVVYLGKRLQREGFTVRIATSGEEAVVAISEEDFDVGVVDLKMPGMDGIETQKQLRQEQPFIQLIVLTGHGSIDSALESGKLDAFKYMNKPVDYQALVTNLRTAAEKKREFAQEQFRKEMEEIASSYSTPQAILKASEELRKKYNLE